MNEHAKKPAPAKGPPVWLDLDQRELDDAYDQIKYAANRDQVVGRWRSNSDITRANIPSRRLKYGTPDIEGADLYPTKAPKAPVNIFIHGGAWRAQSAAFYGFAAEPFVAAGAHFVAIDFGSVGDTNGDLFPMVDQCRRAVAYIAKNAASFGGDPDRIYLSGHSSGAHLAGVMAVTDWEKDFGLPANLFKGALLSSGMYDLKPVRLSARSTYVNFTDAMEHELSAQRHLHRLNAPLVVAYGSLETPEFQRQSRDFVAAVKAAGKAAELLVGDGYNHFEIMETLGNPYGVLGRAALTQMGFVRR
jgi:arylformamidase